MSSRKLVLLLMLVYLCLTDAKKLPVSVYYESLCPDSIRFISEQLYPYFNDVGKYLDLDLVPFGKARIIGREFKCQHGPVECYRNMVHGCVLANNSIASSLDFLFCSMNSKTLSNDTLEKCANKTNISWNSVESCISSGEGVEIFIKNGMKTKSVTPPILFIPTIIFNGVYNEYLQEEAQNHFLKVVCELLKTKPDICKYYGLIHLYQI